MMKYFFIFLFLISNRSAYSINLDSNLNYSDTGKFSAIPVKSLNKGLRLTETLSVNYKPLVYKSDVLVGGIISSKTKLLFGLTDKINLGAVIPYYSILEANSKFGLSNSSGLGDISLSMSVSLFDSLTVSPIYIAPTGKGILQGTSGGFGLGLSYDFNKYELPLYISVSKGFFNENIIQDRNRSQISQISLGYLNQISSDFYISSELNSSIYNNGKGLTNFVFSGTAETDFGSFNASFFSGFLNKSSENNYGLSIGYSLFFGSKKKVIHNNITQTKRTKMRRQPSSIDKKGDVVFYSEIKLDDKVKEKQRDSIKKEALSTLVSKINYVSLIYTRYLQSQKTLSYFLSRYKEGSMSLKKALIEFNWSLRVLKKRRNYITKLVKEKNLNGLKFLEEYKKKTIDEKAIINIIKTNRNELKKIIAKEKSEVASIKESKNQNKKPLIDTELKEAQEKAWAIAKTKTLQDLIKEKKYRIIKREKVFNKKEIINIKTSGIKSDSFVAFGDKKIVNSKKDKVKKHVYSIPKLKRIFNKIANFKFSQLSFEQERRRISRHRQRINKNHDYTEFYQNLKTKIKTFTYIKIPALKRLEIEPVEKETTKDKISIKKVVETKMKKNKPIILTELHDIKESEHALNQVNKIIEIHPKKHENKVIELIKKSHTFNINDIQSGIEYDYEVEESEGPMY